MSEAEAPSGASLFFSAKRTSLSPLFCLSGGLAARLAWLFRVADGADDEEGAKEALMIVINRKRGARLASVCVFLCLFVQAYALFIMLLLDN